MKNEPQSEVDKFFETLPGEDKKEADVFDEKKEAPKPDVPEKETEDDEPHKNRRQRRLEEKLQRERESNIILAERLRAKTEQEEAIRANPDIDARLIKIFGTTDEGKELSKHFADLLSETKEKAREEALQEISKLEESEKLEVAKNEDYIDNQLEALEDAYNVDLTSDTPAASKRRQELLTLVEKMSPKDEDGTITDYADFNAVYEVYEEKNTEKIDNSRNKEIASRSMQRSGSGKTPERVVTPGFDGWKKDYNID